LHRKTVGQLSTGGCMDFATGYQKVDETFGVPRHNH
jgi:dihydroxy-acid dehydratase